MFPEYFPFPMLGGSACAIRRRFEFGALCVHGKDNVSQCEGKPATSLCGYLRVQSPTSGLAVLSRRATCGRPRYQSGFHVNRAGEHVGIILLPIFIEVGRDRLIRLLQVNAAERRRILAHHDLAGEFLQGGGRAMLFPQI